MKGKTLLASVIVLFALAMLSVVSADEIVQTGNIEVRFNDVYLDEYITMAGAVGDTVPVRVNFESSINASDVRVKVRMEGHREEISASSSRFDIEEDTYYTKLLNLELPSDLKDSSKEYILYVEISSARDRTEMEYTIKLQRESFELDILSVDYDAHATAGDIVPVSVVVKNRGYNRGDDNYIVASIPALGITSRTYVGDLVSRETVDLENEEDSAYNRVYLRIPESAVTGIYDMEVVAYNDDTKTKVVRKISVTELDSTTDKADDDKDDTSKDDDSSMDDSKDDSTSIVALTVVLVIIFVVLLAVLVVLLTRKEKPIEEVETSYY